MASLRYNGKSRAGAESFLIFISYQRRRFRRLLNYLSKDTLKTEVTMEHDEERKKAVNHADNENESNIK